MSTGPEKPSESPSLVEPLKRCGRCGETKKASEFSKNKTKKTGLSSPCKLCEKSWRDANKELRAATQRTWYQNNKARRLRVGQQWRTENRDKARAIAAKRRATKLKATPIWLTSEDLQAIQQIYAQAKELELATGVPHHVDHILPLQGDYVCGLHVPSNLQVLTAEENLAKNNRFDPSTYEGEM